VKVRGISILTRKAIVTRRFGNEAWTGLYRDLSSAHSCFRSFITADTLIPLPAFLSFHDELMRRFFKNDEPSYFDIGRESSRWALTEGPFKSFLGKQDLAGFVATLSQFHKLYFDDTSCRSEAALTQDGVEFKVVELPEWHPYLEHFIVGYVAEVLEMFCANPIGAVRLSGGTGRTYHYLYPSTPEADRAARAPGEDQAANVAAPEGSTRRLSNREIEVLTLIAQGKTNHEIGDVLGISGKTAQHHVARAYRKIGVSSRVSAALWLAERGLVSSLGPREAREPNDTSDR
jgi:DNA-binding CsgD family transcriptional regulator